MNPDRSKTNDPQEASSVLARTVANLFAAQRIENKGPQVNDGEIRAILFKWRIDSEQTSVTLRPGESAVFGRSSRRCTHAIPSDPCISGQHFRVECSVNEVRLVDLGSRNGTYVNGVGAESVAIVEHDQIVAGTTLFELQINRKS